MSPLLLLGIGGALAACAAAGARHVLRQREVSRAQEAMRRRLAEVYPEAGGAAKAVPLRAPRGRVAVGPDGLAIAFGDDALRDVPWSSLRGVQAVGGGAVSVRVAGVGEVLVPGAVGRSLWDHAASQPAGAAERSRADRV